jgi:hypothetical protein
MRSLRLVAYLSLAILGAFGCGSSSTKTNHPDGSPDGTAGHGGAPGSDANDAPQADAPGADVPAVDQSQDSPSEQAPEVAADPCSMCGANATCTLHAPAPDGGADAGDAGGGSDAGADGGAEASADGGSADAGAIGPCVCNPGYAGDGVTCVAVAASLSGLRWELPCASDPGAGVACNVSDATKMATLTGQVGKTYFVTLRFRGVLEQKTYTGGTVDGYWVVGGAPAGDTYNVYQLKISSPDETFYLNDGTSMITQCWPLDYTKTIDMDANALVTLAAQAIDGQEIKNIDQGGTPIVTVQALASA